MPAPPTSRRSLALLALAAAVLLLTGLGRTDLWAPDEPRYAQIAEELRSLEDGARGLVVLQLNGEAYSQKPPLYYWAAASLGALVGRVGEVEARLPSALAGIGLVVLTALIGRYAFGHVAPGLLGGALLLTVFQFAHLARRAQLDVVLALFEGAAIAAFWAVESGATRRRRGAVAVFHGALGLAALTKGPVGWLPMAVIAGWLLLERRGGDLRRWLPAWALALSVGPLLVWFVGAVALAPEGFFGAAFLVNVFGRFFEGTSHPRPFYYFLYQLPLGFLPWTLLWPLVVVAWRRRDASDPTAGAGFRFLLAWAGVFLVFFTLSAGKRWLYLLPAYPALALLCGAALHDWLQRHERLPRAATAALCACAVGIALVGALALSGVGPELAVETPAAFGVAAIVIGALALLGAACLRGRARPVHAVALSIATVAALELALFVLVYPAWNPEKSPAPVAQAVARLTRPDEVVGIFDHPSLAGGIVYYGDRRVVMLPRPAQVKAYFDGGGRILISKRFKLPWIAEEGPFEILARARSGQREMVVVARSPEDQGAGGPPVAAAQ